MDGLGFDWLMHAMAEPWPAPPEHEPKAAKMTQARRGCLRPAVRPD
jgi:hypothetical protein